VGRRRDHNDGNSRRAAPPRCASALRLSDHIDDAGAGRACCTAAASCPSRSRRRELDGLGALGNADLTAADVDGEDARASAVGG